MNWLDVFIVIFLISAFIRGIEMGFVRQFFSAFGFFVGFFAGAWLESHLIGHLDSSDSRAVFALLVTLGFAVLLMLVGEYIGLRIKFKLSEGRVADRLDRIFGSVLAIITLLTAVWLGASIFRNFPSEAWQRQIRSSRVIAALNENLPSAPALLTKLGHLIDPNGFPQVFTGLERSVETDTPLPDIGELTPAVQKTRISIVKIEGEGCGGIVQGSGFVAGDDEVITNAHVVAGVDEPMIIDANGQHDAIVVWFDPELDLAVLRVRNLAGPALTLRTAEVSKGSATAIVGFPGGEGFRAEPAAVLESFTAIGRDIYNHGSTERRVYSLKGNVEQGNSGGPVIAPDGSVIGVLFAKSTSYDQVGYALTADQAAAALTGAQSRSTPVASSACAE